MGERKVLNKYYPADFDPAKIGRRRQPKNQQNEVRMMLPMSVRCKTCGSYTYKGTKFNSRKEDVIGETYLGIQIYRFYFKCTHCSAQLAIRTDPKNSDYVVEAGATRNVEPYYSEETLGDGTTMKSLEERTLESKREMDTMATLDEMKSMRSRRATVSVDAVLAALQSAREDREKKLDEEDEALVQSIFGGRPKQHVRRILDDQEWDDDDDDDDEILHNNIVKRPKLSDRGHK